MPETSMRERGRVVIDVSQHGCPACGARDRWERPMMTYENGKPALIVWCDCGGGELKIIVEK